MNHLETCLNTLFEDKKISNVCIKAGQYDKVLLECFKSANGQINEHTLFDMASVSKIMSCTQLALIALDRGMLKLDDKVSGFFFLR